MRQIPITIIAPEFTYNPRSPFGLLQIANDSTFKNATDLNGKTIGVPALNDLNMLAARAWVDKNGGDWKSLKFVETNFLVGGFIARADWVQQHADIARKFARGLAEAGAYVNAHQAETLPLVAELTKIPLATTEKMHRSLNATALDPQTVQVLIDATAKYELIPRTFQAREIVWTG